MKFMASQQEIAHETNVRFWISTQYKMGDALNPDDPTDRMHAKFWLDIYRDLARQNALGTLTLTYKDPSFERSLNEAITASRIERSLHEDDPRYAEARRARAQAVNDAGLWQEIIMSRRPAVSAWPTFGGMLGEDGAAVSGWYDIVVGSAIDDLREQARGYATAARGNAAGVIQTADGRFSGRGFPSLDAAIDWLQRSTSRRGDFIYAAAYEKGQRRERVHPG